MPIKCGAWPSKEVPGETYTVEEIESILIALPEPAKTVVAAHASLWSVCRGHEAKDLQGNKAVDVLISAHP